jgi:hypothetical protein
MATRRGGVVAVGRVAAHLSIDDVARIVGNAAAQ